MIEAHQLHKQFEAFTAVHEVSLNVAKGELLALLGPNGAGKTTSIRMISSILPPTSGWARINGHDVVAQPDAVRRSIGMLTEQPGLYERMTSMEYLQFYGRLYGMNKSDIQDKGLALLNRFNMPGTADRRLGDFSKGMKQKVGLIRAMLHNPAVLLLDEPTSAMDPHSAKLVRDAISEMRSDDRAVVLCTHNLPEAERLADRIAIINAGRIVAKGTVAELKQQLLGAPTMELTLDRPLNGQTEAFKELIANGPEIEIETAAANTIRYNTPDPIQTNPQLIRHLSGLGLGVVTLHEITRSLEEVYLSVVSEEKQETPS